MFIKGSKVTGTISIINIFAIWLYFGQNVPHYAICVLKLLFSEPLYARRD